MKLYLPLLILAASINISYASEINDKTEAAILSAFGDDIRMEEKLYPISKELKTKIQNIAKQVFFRNEVYVWKIFRNDSTVGFAILDNVKGKSLPITFLVIFNSEGKIIKSEIIKYREQIGGEIGSEKWNEQFIGKNAKSGFLPGEDIHGISGATISVISVSKGIKKLAYLIEEIKGIL